MAPPPTSQSAGFGEGRRIDSPRCRCFKRVAAPQTLAFAAIELVLVFDLGWILVSLVLMGLGAGLAWVLLVAPIHAACAVATLRDKHAGTILRLVGQRKPQPRNRDQREVPRGRPRRSARTVARDRDHMLHRRMGHPPAMLATSSSHKKLEVTT